jgi:hypothetical protein
MQEVYKTIKPKEALTKAKYYAGLAKLGALSYDDGKAMAKPYLDAVNHAGKQIAAKFGRKYSPITYSALLR